MSDRILVPFRITLNFGPEYYESDEVMLQDGLRLTQLIESSINDSSHDHAGAHIRYTESRRGSLIHEGFLILMSSAGMAIDIGTEISGKLTLSLWLLEKIRETVRKSYKSNLKGFRAETGEELGVSEDAYEKRGIETFFPRSFSNVAQEGRVLTTISAGSTSRVLLSAESKAKPRFSIGWNVETALLAVIGALVLFGVISDFGPRNSMSDRLLVAETKLAMLEERSQSCSSEQSIPFIFDWEWLAAPNGDASEASE